MAFMEFLLTDFTIKNRDCQQTIYELVSRETEVIDGESSGDFRVVTSVFYFYFAHLNSPPRDKSYYEIK